MKTFFKLNIILAVLLSGLIFASPVNNVGHNNTKDSQKLSSISLHQLSNSDEELICFDGIDQLDYQSLVKYINSFINTPEAFGEFKKYFSTQSLLPDIRTDQRFNKKLRI